jgi:hypothetical protein
METTTYQARTRGRACGGAGLFLGLAVILAMLASCGQSIFGPREVADDFGANPGADIDAMLHVADDFYLGADGGVDPSNKIIRLSSARKIYSNLVYVRWDGMRPNQKLHAVRGYCNASLDLVATNVGGVVSSALELFAGFDPTTLAFTNTGAQARFTRLASPLHGEIVGTLLTPRLMLSPDAQLAAARGEGDYVAISLYHGIATGYDLVGALLPVAQGGMAIVTNLSAKFDAFEASVNDFEAALNALQAELGDPFILTNTARLVSLSNQVISLSNSTVSAALAVSNAYVGGMALIDQIDQMSSAMIARNASVTRITHPAKNEITVLMNAAMSTALQAFIAAFEVVRAFRDGDPESLLKKYL